MLVFDADGVVITPPHRFTAYMQNILHVRREDSDAFFRGAFIDCLLGRADLKESIAPFLPRWGWKGSVDALLQCWFDVENNVNHELVHVIQSLRHQGYVCAVATNQERYRLRYMRHEMRFDELFDAVVGSADVGAMKPDAAFYRAVTDRLGIRPEDVQFWDDSQANVDGARACGWQADVFTCNEDVLRALRALEVRACPDTG